MRKLGLVLSLGIVITCVTVHIATFFTVLSLTWVLPSFVLLVGALLCVRAVHPKPRLGLSGDPFALTGWVLLVYAILTFVYFYRTTGGASSVGIVDGQYVSEYQGRIIRNITEAEYKMFPNLWTRVMTAWICMIGLFVASSLRVDSIEGS